MLRRSILEISSRRPIRRFPTRIPTQQTPSHLSSRKEFSAVSQPKSSTGSDPTGKSSDSGSSYSKVLLGSIAIGAAALTAYQTGYLDKLLNKEQNQDLDADTIHTTNEEPQQLTSVHQNSHDDEPIKEQLGVQNVKEPEVASPTVEHGEKNIETDPYYSRRGEETASGVKQLSESEPPTVIPDQEVLQKDLDTNQEVKPTVEHREESESAPVPTQSAPDTGENEMKSEQPQNLGTINTLEDALSNGIEEPNSLIDAYFLSDKAEETAAVSSYLDKDIAEAVKSSNDVYVSKDGKLVLDFLQAIHTAEKRQAELDAHIFSEEKRAMKEKYGKELKDARARELMYAERETILDKELHKEKLKAAAALKSLQEKLEEEFRTEIEKKEAETELELKKLVDMAKAELTAAIANEKASQIEKMAEANLNINALCMAFYARSEEARQSHSVHKLALGALALEDALSKGLPIQKEIDALNSYLDGIDKDSLLGLVMASLPEDTLKNGTNTILQLNHKFDGLKGTLRHFSLMPPGGGGILAHSLAHIASMLKVKEADQSGDGIESLINRVEGFLADGKLMKAAETLEKGLKGSEAGEVVGDWVRQARNRAITEQALTLLQSYATSVSLT